MFRKLVLAAGFATLAVVMPAWGQDAKYSTATQTIGELVGNESTKAVLAKHIPAALADPRLQQAYEMKFADIVQFAPDQLTPEKLKAIDEDLAKLK